METRMLAKFALVMAVLTLPTGCCDHCADLASLAVSRDSKLVASLCGESRACIWNAGTGKLIQKIEDEKSLFSSVAYSPKGDLLATGSDDGTVTLWDWGTRQKTSVLQNGIHIGEVISEAFSPNGEELATAGKVSSVRVWSVKTRMLIRELPESTMPYQDCSWQKNRLSGPPPGWLGWDMTCLAYSLAYSPDGKMIAVGSKLWLRLWDAESGALLRTFPGAAEIGAIAFSPDGELLASSGENGRVGIWNVSAGSQVRELQLSDRPLRAIAFSPDGKLLAASGWDGTIYICDSKWGTLVRKIAASRGAVNWVLFSSEGADIISGSRDDDFFAIWQADTGKLLRRISCRSAV